MSLELAVGLKVVSSMMVLVRVDVRACQNRAARQCRPTSRISDGAPNFRRIVADTEACGTVGRVHFIVTRSLHAVVRRHPEHGLRSPTARQLEAATLPSIELLSLRRLLEVRDAYSAEQSTHGGRRIQTGRRPLHNPGRDVFRSMKTGSESDQCHLRNGQAACREWPNFDSYQR